VPPGAHGDADPGEHDRGRAAAPDSDDQRAYEAGLRLIAYRDRTVHELRTRLADKGFAPEAIERALERLKRLGYLDDAAYCERTITETLASRPAGPRWITDRLRLKGVHPEVIREVLARAYPDELSEQMACRVAAKRLSRYRGDEPQARRRKLAGYLSRRGFDYDDVQKALRRVLGELDDET
jgi:regulatory protein